MKNKDNVIASKILTGAFMMMAANPVVQAQDSTSIRPFHINYSDSALVDLRQRILATRWPGWAQAWLTHKAMRQSLR